MSASLGPWLFVVLGLVLIAAELAMPGAFLVWFGIAALAVAAVEALFAPPWQISLVLFCLFAAAAVLAARALTRSRREAAEETPILNRRGEALVGRVFALASATSDGDGTIRVDDTVWRVAGPAAPVGTKVRVLRVVGTRLDVEPVAETVPPPG